VQFGQARFLGKIPFPFLPDQRYRILFLSIIVFIHTYICQHTPAVYLMLFDKYAKPVKHLKQFGIHIHSVSYHIGTTPISTSLN
jgi:hypothetical protein